MTEEQVQDVLNQLQAREDHKVRDFSPEFGDPWSGYTKLSTNQYLHLKNTL